MVRDAEDLTAESFVVSEDIPPKCSRSSEHSFRSILEIIQYVHYAVRVLTRVQTKQFDESATIDLSFKIIGTKL